MVFKTRDLFRGIIYLILIVIIYYSFYYLSAYFFQYNLDLTLNTIVFVASIYFFSLSIRGVRYSKIVNVGIEGLHKVGPAILGVYISWGVNSFLPGRVGEICRIFVAKRCDNISQEESIDSIIIEKIFDILNMTLIGLFTFLLILNSDDVQSGNLYVVFLVSIFIFSTILVVFILNLDKFNPILNRIPLINNILVRLSNIIQKKMRLLLSDKKLLLQIFLISLTIWILDSITFYLIVRSFSDIRPSISIFIVVIGFLTFIFPVLPNGVGQFEGMVAILFTIFGYDGGVGFNAALLDHVIKTVVALILGSIASVVFILRTTRKN